MLPRATASSFHAPAEGAAIYQRRLPETTLLYRTVQGHWLDFLAEIEAGGGELPAFVRDEFAAYLRCGILAHGFVRVHCQGCGHARAVAFSDSGS